MESKMERTRKIKPPKTLAVLADMGLAHRYSKRIDGPWYAAGHHAWVGTPKNNEARKAMFKQVKGFLLACGYKRHTFVRTIHCHTYSKPHAKDSGAYGTKWDRINIINDPRDPMIVEHVKVYRNH
jgi:hypothetical protein